MIKTYKKCDNFSFVALSIKQFLIYTNPWKEIQVLDFIFKFFIRCLVKSRSVLRDDEPPGGAADDGPSHHRATHTHLHCVSIIHSHSPSHSSHPWSHHLHNSLPPTMFGRLLTSAFSHPLSSVTSQWIGSSLTLSSPFFFLLEWIVLFDLAVCTNWDTKKKQKKKTTIYIHHLKHPTSENHTLSYLPAIPRDLGESEMLQHGSSNWWEELSHTPPPCPHHVL